MTLEEQVRRLVEALGASPVRLRVLHDCLRFGPVTSLEVADRLGISLNAARSHLFALEACGLVRGDRTRPGTRRWRFLWVADPKSVSDLVDDLDVFLLDASAPERTMSVTPPDI